MIDQFLDGIASASATVMLELCLESLLYWKEPRQGVPSGFPNRRRGRTFLRLKSECDKLGYSNKCLQE